MSKKGKSIARIMSLTHPAGVRFARRILAVAIAGVFSMASTCGGDAGTDPDPTNTGGIFRLYDGIYVGQFNMIWEYMVPDASGGETPVTGSSGFSLTLTLKSAGPLINGYALMAATHANSGSAFFDCLAGCTPLGNGMSGATLPHPGLNVSPEPSGIGIAFPNGVLLTSIGAIHMSSDGRIIGNSPAPSTQPRTWHAGPNDDLINSGFERWAVPEAFVAPSRDFRVTSMTWALTRSAL